MNYHIVRNGDNLEKIAAIYNLEPIEIKEVNPHIRSFENLVPGLKLRLPEIPDSLAIELNDVEPFIEDYYPKLPNIEKPVEEKLTAQIENSTEELASKPPTINKKHNKNQSNYNKYNYYYNPYFYYPYYNMYRKRIK